jgi:hypothetical protein
MAKHANTFIQFTIGDEDRMGRIVASLMREHVAFDLSYHPGGVIVIAVEQYDEDELHQIIMTTI